MKYCPSCQIKYADETLQFCLQDGTGLLDYSETSAATQHWSEKETVVRQAPVTAGFEPVQRTQNAANESEAKKSGKFPTIVVTALAMSLLFGGIIGGWFLLKNNDSDNKNLSRLSPTRTPSPSPTPTKTNERNQNDNTDGSSDWEIDNNLSFNGGERITFYSVTGVEQCQKDCAGNSRCVAFTLIRAGFYNSQDPPMCYLMAEVNTPSASTCCISGIKKGVNSGKTDGPQPPFSKK